MDGLPAVSVILVGHHDQVRLGRCLAALLAQDYSGELEILFAADQNAADTLAEVRADAPDIAITDPASDGVPGHAAQFGRDWGRGEILAFLDPATDIDSDWLAALVQPFIGGVGQSSTAVTLVWADDWGRIEALDAAAARQLAAGLAPSGNGTGPAWPACGFALRTDRRRRRRLVEPFLRTLGDADASWEDIATRLVALITDPTFDAVRQDPARRGQPSTRGPTRGTPEADKPSGEDGSSADPPFGRQGVLVDDGERIQCHLCGRYFGNLGTHSARTHGLPAAGYRRRFGLRARTSLLGPPLRERRRAQALARIGTPAFARFIEAGRHARATRPPDAATGIRAEKSVEPLIPRPERIALAALAVLAVAEVVTAFGDVRWGVALHALLLALLAERGARAIFAAGQVQSSHPPFIASFVTALSLAPLTRIVSLALPLTEFAQTAWYAIVAVPMLLAAWAACRANGYDRRDVGLVLDLRRRSIALALAVGASGVVLGFAEYRILSPDPLIDHFGALPFLAATASLVFGTGLTEEFIFRGVIQRASIDVLGSRAGIAYAAAVFAILHVGHRSALDVGFVFLVALAFGVVVRITRSLTGVIVAHSLTNVCLFLIFPLLKTH